MKKYIRSAEILSNTNLNEPRTTSMKRVIRCGSGDMYVGKFVIVLSDKTIEGMDNDFYHQDLPGYAVCTMVVYNKITNTLDGNASNHIALESLLNPKNGSVIRGSVDISVSGGREITFNDDTNVTPNVTEFIKRMYNL